MEFQTRYFIIGECISNGKWDDSESKCVECSAISNKGEGKIFGDPSAIRIDCSIKSDLFSVTAPSTAGTYTYKAKSYAYYL